MRNLEELNKITEKVIGFSINVHKELGPGLLESVYQQCLAYELSQLEIKFEMEKELPVKYKEVFINCGYRMDFMIEDNIILELKSVEKLLPIHTAQLLTYMKLANVRLGLLINFNVKVLIDGIKRLIL